MEPDWIESFENFLKDMGDRPSLDYSLDRIDNSKGYFKENCRWATRKTQMNNRGVNHVIGYDGVEMTVAEWAESLGIPYTTFSARVQNLFKGTEPRGQHVQMTNPQTGETKVFNSAKEASQKTGVGQAAIRKCLCKHNKTAGGFFWEFC